VLAQASAQALQGPIEARFAVLSVKAAVAVARAQDEMLRETLKLAAPRDGQGRRVDVAV
jgi:hypothetical protein